jgi:hypothetical protein
MVDHDSINPVPFTSIKVDAEQPCSNGPSEIGPGGLFEVHNKAIRTRYEQFAHVYSLVGYTAVWCATPIRGGISALIPFHLIKFYFPLIQTRG